MDINFRIKDAACDVESIKKRFYASKGENAVKNLKKNGFEAYYAEDKAQAA